jgi:hypothetical protein
MRVLDSPKSCSSLLIRFSAIYLLGYLPVYRRSGLPHRRKGGEFLAPARAASTGLAPAIRLPACSPG